MSGADEVFELAKDLGRQSKEVASALYDVFVQEGETFARDWAANAKETSGEHGKHYPASIDSETKMSLDIHVVTGPNSGKRQGSMGRGFELGSVNQPPHLDGLRALPIAERRLERATGSALGFLLG